MKAPSTPKPAINVAPRESDWFDEVSRAVQRAGGQLADLGECSGLVWLSNGRDTQLPEFLRPDISWVQLRSAGVEQWLKRGDIDRERCWTSARGAYAAAVAEHGLALILAGVKSVHRFARTADWHNELQSELRQVGSSSIAVIGAGAIGRALIGFLVPLGAHTIAVTRSGGPVPGANESLGADQLDSALSRADVVVLTLPSTTDTHGLIDRRKLAIMRPHAWIVNVGRGDTLIVDDLAEALRAGTIGGAALDVTEPEPLPVGHPLWADPRVLITSHVANPDAEQRRRFCALVERNVARFGRGDPLEGTIDPIRGY